MRLLAIEDINVVLLVRERLSGLNSVEAHLGVGGMSDSRRVGMRIKDGDLKRVKNRVHTILRGCFSPDIIRRLCPSFVFLELKYLQISSV